MRINIALAFDDNYIKPFYVLLNSIFVNNSHCFICIHIIATGITLQQRQDIIDFVQEKGGQISFYKIEEEVVSQFVLPDHEGNYLSSAIYYRLFFPFLIKKVDKLLYIDVDTLVVGSLNELFQINIDGCPAAAVTDTDMPLRSDLDIGSTEEYFNSGVLLIDIAAWKKQQITEQALQIIKVQPDRIKRYPDQDALNMVLRGNWYRLPTSYNLMRLYVPNEIPRRLFPAFLKEQKIIHYNGKKPWFDNCEHRLRHIYLEYARLSPIVGSDNIIKVSLSKEKRKLLFRSRMIDFYYDHPRLVSVWRKLKCLIGK